jgi:hypothetical protein
MPQIIVTAGDRADLTEGVMLRERINASDFESDRFAANLVERLGWAVSDAIQAEEGEPGRGHSRRSTDRVEEAPARPELVRS